MDNVHEYTEMIGKVFVSVEAKIDGGSRGDELIFTDTDGAQYIFAHWQNCCESVTIDDIVGDLSDLVGSPLLMAEAVAHHNENIDGVPPACADADSYPYCPESFTWTFYKFATNRGYVTVRWLGTSNGCYSESVDFEVVQLPDVE